MCLIDWKIGRLARTVWHRQVTDGNGQFTIPQNKNRIVLFFPQRNGGIQIIVPEFTPTPWYAEDSGDTLPLILTLKDHGGIVQQSFDVISPDFIESYAVWGETTLPESQLTMLIEQLAQGR